ncbi:hypothetical protein Tco_1510722 [Tanacetum coccineum]
MNSVVNSTIGVSLLMEEDGEPVLNSPVGSLGIKLISTSSVAIMKFLKVIYAKQEEIESISAAKKMSTRKKERMGSGKFIVVKQKPGIVSRNNCVFDIKELAFLIAKVRKWLEQDLRDIFLWTLAEGQLVPGRTKVEKAP